MSESSVTANGLTLNGFNASDTFAGTANTAYGGGIFGGAFGFAEGTSNDYVWNWSAGLDSNGNTGSQVVTATGSGTDSWTLTVQLVDYSGSADGGETVVLGATSTTESTLTGGGGPGTDGTEGTINGSGAAALQAAFQNLYISAPATDTFAVQFTLDDTTVDTNQSQVQSFTEYFATCYALGTKILGSTGEIAVEDIRIGDLVATRGGIAKPVKWIGRRAYTPTQVAGNSHLRPVLIRQDALEAGLPRRDLLVSPMHALFIDDVFVPAAALINGVSILRSDATDGVDYIHVELEDHDVIFAEGVAAETFVDDNSRLIFDNADEYYDLYGADEMPRGFSAPRIESGYQLEAIRRRLSMRAGLTAAAAERGRLRGHVERITDGVVEGWVFDEADATVPVELDVLVDGEMVARVLANRYRVDLDHAGHAGGRCAFSVALPASAVDPRQLEIRRTGDGAKLPMPQVLALVD